MQPPFIIPLLIACCCFTSCEDKAMVSKNDAQKLAMEQLRSELKLLKGELPMDRIPERLAALEVDVTETKADFEEAKLEVMSLEDEVKAFKAEKEVAIKQFEKYRSLYPLEAAE